MLPLISNQQSAVQMKKKRDRQNSVHNKIVIPEDIQSGEPEIRHLFERLKNADNFDTQQQTISQLGSFLKSQSCLEHKESVVNLLTFIFLTINPKLPIKKTIIRILQSSESAQIEACLAKHLQYFIKAAEKLSEVDISLCNEICNYTISCTENYPPGLRAISSVAPDALKFVTRFLKQLVCFLDHEIDSVQKKLDVFTYIHNTTRVLLSLIQKCNVDKDLTAVSVVIVQCCSKILYNDQITFDTKANCGLIIVYSFDLLPSELLNHFMYRNKPPLELLRCSLNDGFCLHNLGIKNYYENHSVKVAIYSGILNMVGTPIFLFEKLDGILIFNYLFTEIMCCVKSTTCNSAQILEASHALTLLSRSFDKIPLNIIQPLYEEGLNFVWTHLDHHVDMVRHMAKTVFRNFIKLALLHQKQGNDCLLKLVFEDVNALPLSNCTRYVALMQLATEISCSSLLFNVKLLLPHQMLNKINDQTLAPQICTLYEYLMEKHFIELTPQYEDVWILQWVKIILRYLKDANFISSASFYQRLLITAFKINPSVLRIIMQYPSESTPSEFRALLGCLRVARKSGLQICVNRDLFEKKSLWRGLIDESTLTKNMFHQDNEIRVSVLALIVESQKSTEIFTPWELNFLRMYLYYNVTTQEPSIRKEMINLFKKALVRIQEGWAVLDRTIRHLEGKQIKQTRAKSEVVEHEEIDGDSIDELKEATKDKNRYVFFLGRLLQDCLLPGLQSDANYPRRSSCLELLSFFQRTFPDKRWEDMWSKNDTINLKNVIMFDSYESNKQMAVTVYKRLSHDKLQLTREGTFQDLRRCLKLASDLKPCNTMAAAYMLDACLHSPYLIQAIQKIGDFKEQQTGTVLLDLTVLLMTQIENKLRYQGSSFEVDKSFSMYGFLFSMRYLMEKTSFLDNSKFWAKFLSDHLINVCFKIYNLVSSIVTNPSPEGLLPENCELDDLDDKSTIAQAALVLSWRNVKEVSLLLGDVVYKVTLKDDNNLVNEEILQAIGDFFVKLFVQTKHRGVFEQAYLGFRKICEGFWRSSNASLKELPETWLKRMLEVLSSKETCEGLCPTRRSAGLPFLILAILTTEPISRVHKSFHECMGLLLTTASDTSLENSERRTHCMNVLRALYRHNELGELVSQYVGRGMIVAVTGFKSFTWSVRNSATLLYATLVIRMFGVQRTKDLDCLSTKNKMTVKVFFMRYPELQAFLLSELREGSDFSGSHTLYPVLLIFSRLYPSNLKESTDVNFNEFLALLNKCLPHPSYRTRQLAAQASVPFIPPHEIVHYLIKLLTLLSNKKLSNNQLHGLLVQLLYLIERLPRDLDLDLSSVTEPTFWILTDLGKRISSILTSLYVELLILLIPRFVKSGVSLMVTLEIQYQMKSELAYSINLHFLKMYLTANILVPEGMSSFLVADDILTKLNSKCSDTIRFYLNIINYLNFEKPAFSMHSLYIAEELEISKKEYTIVQAFSEEFRKHLLKELNVRIKGWFQPTYLEEYLKDAKTRIPALFLLQNYPCIVHLLCPLDNMFDYLTNLPYCDNSECLSVLISCISSALKHVDIHTFLRLKFRSVVKILLKSCAPYSDLHLRLSVCDLLLNNRMLLGSWEPCITFYQLFPWSMVMTLLEDDDVMVRNQISQLTARQEYSTLTDIPQISEHVRETLLAMAITVMPLIVALRFLLTWHFRALPYHSDNDSSLVFGRGGLNSYAETFPIVRLTLKLTRELLWSLKDGLNYEDRSVFLEEMALLATDALLNALRRPIEEMTPEIYLAMRQVLVKLAAFLEVCPVNKKEFKACFRKTMTGALGGDLAQTLGKDDFERLHMFFWTVYGPGLNS